jgi:hypothetical protein
MTSQLIGSNRLAIYIEEEELKQHGILSGTSCNEQIKPLVESIFRSSGINARGDMEIEVYDSRAGLMVFAWVGELFSHEQLVFSTLDDLLDAADSLAQPVYRSDLIFYDGRYYLEICDFICSIKNSSMRLSEFGFKSHVPKELLSEYGTHIAKGDAINKLREVVLRK